MAELLNAAIEQYGFFLELTLSNCVRVNCRLMGVSVNARKQETLLKFELSTGQLFCINIDDILYINKGTQF